jgi:hypothetical protein
MAKREAPDEIEQLLKQGYDAPPPGEAFAASLRSRLQVARAGLEPSASGRLTAAPVRTRRRIRRSGMLAIVVAILAALGVLPWLVRPSDTWAQVAEAVRARPWIRLTGRTPDGVKMEAWLSLSRKLIAQRHGKNASFEDHRRGLTYRYDASEKTLYRIPEGSDSSRQGFLAMGRLLNELFRAEEPLPVDLPGLEILKQSRREVEDEGRTWIEYDLTFRGPGDGSTRLMFRVDPATRLPHSITAIAGDMQVDRMQAIFGYPDEGPEDIYGLGVPRDAKLVDLTPSADVQQLVAAIKRSAEHFGPHRVLNVQAGAEDPWYRGLPHVVWSSHGRWRMEYGIADPGTPLDPPAPDVDKARWWKERWKTLWHLPHEISDGRFVHVNFAKPQDWDGGVAWKQADWPKPEWKTRPASQWPASTRPLDLVYPQEATRVVDPGWSWRAKLKAIGVPTQDAARLLDRTLKVEVNENPKDGPAGTVLLAIRVEIDQQATSATRRWLDPARSHMVVRTERVTYSPKGAEHVYEVITVEEARQSPRGIWYPAAMRHLRFGTETRSWHFFDFDVELPDSLFEPGQRAGAN